jgi:hypothetical protein
LASAAGIAEVKDKEGIKIGTGLEHIQVERIEHHDHDTRKSAGRLKLHEEP